MAALAGPLRPLSTVFSRMRFVGVDEDEDVGTNVRAGLTELDTDASKSSVMAKFSDQAIDESLRIMIQ